MGRARKWLKDIFNLIDVTPVIIVHYRRVIKDSPLVIADLFVLLGIPLLSAGVAIYTPVSSGLVSRVIPALAILIGFSVNAVILMAGEPLEPNEKPESRAAYSKVKSRKQALIHTRTNTLYALIVGLIALLIAIISSAALHAELSRNLVIALSFILYFLLIHYFITLLMVARRLYILVEKDSFGLQ